MTAIYLTICLAMASGAVECSSQQVSDMGRCLVLNRHTVDHYSHPVESDRRWRAGIRQTTVRCEKVR